MKQVVQENAKAIAALLTPVVAFAATKAGLQLDDGASAGIAAALTSIVVYLVPNSYGKAVKESPDAAR